MNNLKSYKYMANNLLLMEEDVMDKQIKYKDKDGNEKEVTVGGVLKKGEGHPAYDQARQIADKEKGDDKKDDVGKLSGSDFDRDGSDSDGPEKKASEKPSLGQRLKSKAKGFFKGKDSTDSTKKSTKPGEAAKAVLDDPAKLKSMSSSEVKDVMGKLNDEMWELEKKSDGLAQSAHGTLDPNFEDEDDQEKWWELRYNKNSLKSTIKKKEHSEASDKMETAADEVKAIIDDPTKMDKMSDDEIKKKRRELKHQLTSFGNKSDGWAPTGVENRRAPSFEDEDDQMKWFEANDALEAFDIEVVKRTSNYADESITLNGKKYKEVIEVIEVKEATVKKHPLREMYERIGGK